jgi:hypothetical protein
VPQGGGSPFRVWLSGFSKAIPDSPCVQATFSGAPVKVLDFDEGIREGCDRRVSCRILTTAERPRIRAPQTHKCNAREKRFPKIDKFDAHTLKGHFPHPHQNVC